MYLQEIEIFGFKSFPEKTSLKFEPGITVIVGPNGCGKSNILDAIKWALGEQSPKSLRGSKMEDVIFNGTEKHSPLNYTEVTLTFLNEDNYLPIDYSNVSIGRRLYRSGESQYFINKSPVRLKDIQELFMGTGVGDATYSFVEQGTIEIFLNHKPEEKRTIFDEASGIVRYKERKRETLRRLKDTDDNLLRLEDIISEVKRQIRYLERQVKKARKYKEAKDSLIEIENKISSLNFFDCQQEIGALLEEMNSLKERERERNNGLKKNKEMLDETAAKLDEVRTALENIKAENISLNADINNQLSSIKVSEQRIKELKERNKNIEAERKTLKNRLILQEERLKEETAKAETFFGAEKDIDEAVNDLSKEKSVLQSSIKESRQHIKDGKRKILEAESLKVNINNSLAQVRAALTSLNKRNQRIALDRSRLEAFLNDGRAKLDKAKEELSLAVGNLSAAKERRAGLFKQDERFISEEENARNILIDKDKESVELNYCYGFLRDLRLKFDSFSEQRKVTVSFNEEPKGVNKMIISLKGARFEKEGGVYKADIDAKIISLEEHEIKDKIDELDIGIQNLRQKIERIKTKRQDLIRDIKEEEKRIEGFQKEYQRKFQNSGSLNNEWKRMMEESVLLDKESQGIEKEIRELEDKDKALSGDLEACAADLNKTLSYLSENENLVSFSLEKIKDIDVEIAKKEEQKRSLSKEKDSLSSKISLLEDGRGNLLNILKNLTNEEKENESRLVILEEGISNAAKEIDGLKGDLEKADLKKEDWERKELLFSEDIEKRKEIVNGLEQEVQGVSRLLYDKQLAIQNKENERSKIKDYMHQVYGIQFSPLPKESIDEGIDSLISNKVNIKKLIDSLGEVNLVAIDEFDELKAREEFLNNQKNDLISSKDSLKKAIQKINRTSKDIFLDTFNKIEEEFKKNFRFLFNGGRANLVLLDRDDILESGVDIEVQPPGKRLQNISLLSGGEKALTAISLIFAIFKVRPSPLCVLDEIDAPLDESNIDRFNQVLTMFSSQSQLVIMTHNKKTMSIANCLYGVTMQESGVSKLVSVKFASEDAPS